MRNVILAAFVVLLAFWVFQEVEAQDEESLLSADTLLRISSVVGGWRAPAPKWMPDGSQIVFTSNLSGGGLGGLVGIDSEGGFPIRFPFDLGGTGWFFTPFVIEISPDGEWIAYISTKSGAREVWLWSVDENRGVQLTDMKSRIQNSLSWSRDGKWIALAVDVDGNYDIHKVRVPTGEVIRLTTDERDEVNPAWRPDGKEVLYIRPDESGIDHDVMGVGSDGGDVRLVVSDTDFFDEGGDTLGIPFVSPDGSKVLFRSWRSGWINYWVVSIEGGEPRQVAPEEADQSHGRWSPDGRYIAYCSNHNGTHDLRVVSADGGKARVLVSPESGICGNPEWSPDGKRISYTFTTLTRAKDLYVISLERGESEQLTESMPPGIEERLVKAEKITYSSTDGFEIPAYLYKPKDIGSGEKFPGIIWIHGGPTGQYEEMFQHQFGSSAPSVQYIVQHGYVVLMPNIRGSSGYGKEFEKANNKCWGECDMEDVLAGVDYLKSLPYVDGEKMAMTGRSYGGMLTMAAATNVHSVFQVLLAETGHEDWTKGGKVYDYELGPLPENYDLRWKLSPLSHVEDVSTPIFVILGEGPSPKTSPFVEKLKEYDKEYIAKTYHGDRSSVHSYGARLQSLRDKLVFYDKYLKNKGEGVPK